MVLAGYKELRGLQGLPGVIGGYRRLQGLTEGYKALHGVTGDHKELQEVSGGYKRLQGVIRGYRRAAVRQNTSRATVGKTAIETEGELCDLHLQSDKAGTS